MTAAASPIPPLVVEFDVQSTPPVAFATWVDQAALWWPRGHTIGGHPSAIVFEPQRGGRIFERGRDGVEHRWGEVLEWEPPVRLRFLWHLFFPASEATEVEVTFSATDYGTRVRLVQTGWEALGKDGPARREKTINGWSSVTAAFRAAVATDNTAGGTMTTDPIGGGAGTPENPWRLKTPPQSSEYTMHLDTRDGAEVIVCTVGKTVLLYSARCLDDLHAMLKAHGDWMELGSADEQKPAKDSTVEAWGRSPDNPIGGWYGLKKGLRGRFGMYVPPLMEHLGRAEVEHNPRGNRMRAI